MSNDLSNALKKIYNVKPSSHVSLVVGFTPSEKYESVGMIIPFPI